MKTEYAAYTALVAAAIERERWIKALSKPAVVRKPVGFWAKLWRLFK